MAVKKALPASRWLTVFVLLIVQANAIVRSSSGAGAGQLQPPPDNRPIMNIGETMRSMMCWANPELIQNKKCMTWMTDLCKEKTSGSGFCESLNDYLQEVCDGKTEPEHQNIACGYLQELGGKSNQMPKANAPTKRPPAPGSADKSMLPKSRIEAMPPAAKPDPVSIPAPAALRSPTVKPQPISAPPAPQSAAAPSPSVAAPSEVAPFPSAPAPSEAAPFTEISPPLEDIVEHRDAETQTSDWGREWPRADESMGASKERICNEYPRLMWCKMFMADRKHQQHQQVAAERGWWER